MATTLCIIYWNDGQGIRTLCAGWDDAGEEQHEAMKEHALQNTNIREDQIVKVVFTDVLLPTL